jgi:hypothetical protein
VSYWGGGAGVTASGNAGQIGAAIGSGGGGGGCNTTTWSGAGGGAGGTAWKLFTTPAATYSYSVGGAGSGGAAGTGGLAGGNAQVGGIFIKAHFQ